MEVLVGAVQLALVLRGGAWVLLNQHQDAQALLHTLVQERAQEGEAVPGNSACDTPNAGQLVCVHLSVFLLYVDDLVILKGHGSPPPGGGELALGVGVEDVHHGLYEDGLRGEEGRGRVPERQETDTHF